MDSSAGKPPVPRGLQELETSDGLDTSAGKPPVPSAGKPPVPDACPIFDPIVTSFGTLEVVLIDMPIPPSRSEG